MPMPQRVTRAFETYKYGPPADEPGDLHELVGTTMEHVAEMADLVTGDMVMNALVQGAGESPVVGMLVAGAWKLYLIRRPRGPEAVSEATTWIMKLVPDSAQRKRVFVDAIDNLVEQVG